MALGNWIAGFTMGAVTMMIVHYVYADDNRFIEQITNATIVIALKIILLL